jgi:hypothetical protein
MYEEGLFFFTFGRDVVQPGKIGGRCAPLILLFIMRVLF